MGRGRPRGNPNLLKKRIIAEKTSKPDDIMKHYEAVHLINKNSRTLMKILQLLVSSISRCNGHYPS
jgi:hypothetical protein